MYQPNVHQPRRHLGAIINPRKLQFIYSFIRLYNSNRSSQPLPQPSISHPLILLSINLSNQLYINSLVYSSTEPIFSHPSSHQFIHPSICKQISSHSFNQSSIQPAAKSFTFHPSNQPSIYSPNYSIICSCSQPSIQFIDPCFHSSHHSSIK